LTKNDQILLAHINVMNVTNIEFLYYFTFSLYGQMSMFVQFVTCRKRFSHSLRRTQQYLAVCYTLISAWTWQWP